MSQNTTLSTTPRNKNLQEGEKKIEKYIFSLNKVIGKGSYATVYLGRRITDDMPTAVKVIDKKIFSNNYNVKSIQSEIDIMKKVDHENVVKLLDVYQTNNNMYIVTEFCEDGDLRSYIKKKKKLA
jgi:serine/threonine-protein kinase ULK/ATG1